MKVKKIGLSLKIVGMMRMESGNQFLRCLSDIFLQLHISERSGRGVPVITQAYGKGAYEFRDNAIVVTIPFEKKYSKVGDKVGDKLSDFSLKLNATQRLILNEMQNNPNITQVQLMGIVGLGKTAIQRNVSHLRKNNYIERVGSNKNGYWKVL